MHNKLAMFVFELDRMIIVCGEVKGKNEINFQHHTPCAT